MTSAEREPHTAGKVTVHQPKLCCQTLTRKTKHWLCAVLCSLPSALSLTGGNVF